MDPKVKIEYIHPINFGPYPTGLTNQIPDPRDRTAEQRFTEWQSEHPNFKIISVTVTVSLIGNHLTVAYTEPE